LLAEGTRELEHARVVRLLLFECEQLLYEDVLECSHFHPHGVHLELFGALEDAVVDRATLGVEDQVDEDFVVVGLQEPALRR